MKNIFHKHILIVVILLLVGVLTGQAWGSAGPGSSVGQFTSNSTVPLLAIGELALMSDKHAGKSEAVQGAKALITTTVLTEALKYLVQEKRPTSSARNSFPSGHTSAAFALATVVSDYHPKMKWLAFGAATAIGWSRVDVQAHHWQDVIAGAALGYFTAKHYTHQHLVVTPSGVGVNWNF